MSYNTELCTLPHRNSAIQRCCEARNRAIQKAIEAEIKRLSPNPYWQERKILPTAVDANQQTLFAAGSNAFLAQLPELDSRDNVRDYAACIAHATALDVIEPSQAPRLLYAAQVILSSYRAEAKAVASDKVQPPKTAA
jgi:hypothetical protein